MSIGTSARGALVRVTSLAIAWVGAFPSVALAMGWGASDIYDTEGVASKYKASDTYDMAQGIITAFLGIAIAVFVLKVVLTAVDRMLLAGRGEDGFRLDDIPLVGAYQDPETGGSWTWQRIWTHFAIQILLCVSAMALTGILIGLIKTFLSESGVNQS